MNKEQLLKSLEKKGFSKKIIKSFKNVRREDFVPNNLKLRAYEDTALPIGEGQTISQPYTIAKMLSLLKLKEGQKVLEIGSGSGYVLALLSEIVGFKGRVYGIERIRELINKSKFNLKKCKNIKIYNKNGAFGLSRQAPFDRILMSAACSKIPERVLSQLRPNGIIVAPVGQKYEQSLIVMKRSKNNFIVKERIPGFVFVPFIE